MTVLKFSITCLIPKSFPINVNRKHTTPYRICTMCSLNDKSFEQKTRNRGILFHKTANKNTGNKYNRQ